MPYRADGGPEGRWSEWTLNEVCPVGQGFTP